MESTRYFVIIFLFLIFLTVVVTAEDYGKLTCHKGQLRPNVKVLTSLGKHCPIPFNREPSKVACFMQCALKRMEAVKKDGKPDVEKSTAQLVKLLPDKMKNDAVKIWGECLSKHESELQVNCTTWTKLFDCLQKEFAHNKNCQ